MIFRDMIKNVCKLNKAVDKLKTIMDFIRSLTFYRG